MAVVVVLSGGDDSDDGGDGYGCFFWLGMYVH